MLKGKVWIQSVWLFIFLTCFATASVGQSEEYDVIPVNAKYSFAHNQAPDQLVPVHPSITGTSYQWEQSDSPFGVFANVAGSSTGASLSFGSPLARTTYFRRKTMVSGGGSVYSNTIRYEVVSVNWEDRSYIRTHSVTVAGMTDWKVIDQLPTGSKIQQTDYLDGLGRPVQSVTREAATPLPGSSIWGDIVSFSQFDSYGREAKSYLPYTTTVDVGKYKDDFINQQSQYYTTKYGETQPYVTVGFDNSPLERELTERRPGTITASESTVFDFNSSLDDIKMLTIGNLDNDIPVVTGVYASKTLFKQTNTNAEGKLTIEYTDKYGKLILTKTQIDDSPGADVDGWICVYQVYDNFGQLRYILQPEAVKWLAANSYSFSGLDGAKVLDELCFKYTYDIKGRVVTKKVPGAHSVFMLYDDRNRLVFIQDGNQRQKSPAEWTANIYDEMDRVIITALYHTNKTISQLQADIDNAASTAAVAVTNPGEPIIDLLVDNRNIAITTYKAQNTIEFVGEFESVTNDEFTAEITPGVTTDPVTITSTVHKSPVSESDLNDPAVTTILTYEYYDHYSYPGLRPFSGLHENHLAYATGAEAIESSARVWSMPTGRKVRKLGSNVFLTTTIYYDEKGRGVQTLTENVLDGLDIVTFQYQFDNNLLSISARHSTTGTGYNLFGVLTKYTHDILGRLTGVSMKYGNNPFKDVAEYTYDELGRLNSKRLSPGYTGNGGSELEVLEYSYDIHDRIVGINKDYALKTPGKYGKWNNFFGLFIGYDNTDDHFANGRFDGSVTGQMWNTQGDDAQRKYDYQYDNAGRLVNAQFNQRQSTSDAWSHSAIDFSVTGSGGKIGYDLNGNLQSMIHKGVMMGNTTPIEIDNLQYTYASLSNKLKKVVDAGTAGAANGKFGDFTDGSNGTADDYVYDENGNLIIDLNKNIKDMAGLPNGSGIRYNHLNKPEEIRIAGKGILKIVYNADGEKLQRIYTPQNGAAPVVTSYADGFLYQGYALQFMQFEEGRIRVMNPVNEANTFDFLTVSGNIDLPQNKEGAFEYFIRDYQANIRMVLTERTYTGRNVATMELTRDENEATVFGKIDENGQPAVGNEIRARFSAASIPGQGPGTGWTADIGEYVSRLGNLAGQKTGPNSLLKVMAGDQISANAIYYYQNPVVNTSGTSSLSDVLGALYAAISYSGATPGIAHGSGVATNITSQLSGSVPFASAVSPHSGSTTGNIPKAYLSVLFFDERFNFVGDGSTYQRVSQAGDGALPLTLLDIKAPKNGYAFVYVSNESDEMVYFDNLQVTHERGRIVEENHYYAYGLRIAAISSQELTAGQEGLVKNSYFYNDKELFEEADLNWYDYGFRNYDAQIGRFVQLDPLTDYFPELTPYQYASCDPITNIDIDGLEGAEAVTQLTEITLSEVIVKSIIPKAVPKGNRLLRGIGRFFKGAFNTVVESGKFAINIFNPDPDKNSLVQTVKGVATLGKMMWNDPGGTLNNIWQGIKNTDWKDPYVYGAGITSFLLPGGPIKNLGKVGKLRNATTALQTVERASQSAKIVEATNMVKRLSAAGKTRLRKTAPLDIVPEAENHLWKVGPYKNLKGLQEGLDAHHAGQKAVMEKLIPGYRPYSGPSILVPEMGHTIPKPGVGVVSRRTKGFKNTRQLLARDIYELRRVYGSEGLPNSSLQELIQLNKTMYPDAFIKRHKPF